MYAAVLSLLTVVVECERCAAKDGERAQTQLEPVQRGEGRRGGHGLMKLLSRARACLLSAAVAAASSVLGIKLLIVDVVGPILATMGRQSASFGAEC